MWVQKKLFHFIATKLSIVIDEKDTCVPLRDLGIDSIGFITIVLELQLDYDIEFSDQDLGYDAQITFESLLSKINQYLKG